MPNAMLYPGDKNINMALPMLTRDSQPKEEDKHSRQMQYYVMRDVIEG